MESGLGDGIIRGIIGVVAAGAGVFIGNMLKYRTDANKQSAEDFNIITEKWEKLYATLEEHSKVLEVRVTELESQLSKVIEINARQREEISKLKK